MLFLLFHFEFLIFVANANPPEHFTAPRAKYSTLRKTWRKWGKGVCNIFVKIILQILKTSTFFSSIPLSKKTLDICTFYIKKEAAQKEDKINQSGFSITDDTKLFDY